MSLPEEKPDCWIIGSTLNDGCVRFWRLAFQSKEAALEAITKFESNGTKDCHFIECTTYDGVDLANWDTPPGFECYGELHPAEWKVANDPAL